MLKLDSYPNAMQMWLRLTARTSQDSSSWPRTTFSLSQTQYSCEVSTIALKKAALESLCWLCQALSQLEATSRHSAVSDATMNNASASSWRSSSQLTNIKKQSCWQDSGVPAGIDAIRNKRLQTSPTRFKSEVVESWEIWSKCRTEGNSNKLNIYDNKHYTVYLTLK